MENMVRMSGLIKLSPSLMKPIQEAKVVIEGVNSEFNVAEFLLNRMRAIFDLEELWVMKDFHLHLQSDYLLIDREINPQPGGVELLFLYLADQGCIGDIHYNFRDYLIQDETVVQYYDEYTDETGFQKKSEIVIKEKILKEFFS